MVSAFANWRWRQAGWGAALLAGFSLTLFWLKKAQIWLHVLPSCWFHRVSGLPCPTCGATRATLAFARGDWLAALQWNPLIAAAYTAFLLTGGLMILFALMNKHLNSQEIDTALTKARWWLAGALTANWIYLVVHQGMR